MLSDTGFDFNTVFHQMTMDEVEEANAALDIMIEETNKRMKKK